jgi:hypothetical protein
VAPRIGRGGILFDLLVWDVCFVGLLIGACVGFATLLSPRWAARLVRSGEASPGGAAAFRATYAGLLAAPHILAMGFVWLQNGADDLGASAMATGAILVLAAMWGGSAAGQLLSIALDKTGSRLNWFFVAFECTVGAMIAAPWIAWYVRSIAA